MVASFFSYSGARPLNISYYLSLTLLGQLILLGVSGGGFLLTRTGGFSAPMPLLQRFLALCVHKTVATIKQKSQAHISQDHQHSMAGALGLIRAKHRIYGPLFFWPLFILGQVFALGFNVGVVGMTLARVFFSDTAFGWQSTLQVGPELVHKLVSVVPCHGPGFSPGNWLPYTGADSWQPHDPERWYLPSHHRRSHLLVAFFMSLCSFLWAFAPACSIGDGALDEK